MFKKPLEKILAPNDFHYLKALTMFFFLVFAGRFDRDQVWFVFLITGNFLSFNMIGHKVPFLIYFADFRL